MWRVLGYRTPKSSCRFFSISKETELEAMLIKSEMQLKYPHAQFHVFKQPCNGKLDTFHMEHKECHEHI